MQIVISVFVFTVLLFYSLQKKGEESRRDAHTSGFVFSVNRAFLLTSISNLSIIGLCIGSHLNKTLDISEPCLGLASGLRSDQEVGGRTRAITPVCQADTLWQKMYFVSDRGFLNNIFLSFNTFQYCKPRQWMQCRTFCICCYLFGVNRQAAPPLLFALISHPT